MFYKIIPTIKRLMDNTTILMIISVGIFTLLVDGRRYRDQGYTREVNIIKLISYSYIAVGGLMYVFLLFM